MVRRFKLKYPLPNGSEDRYAYVYLPDSYYRNPKRRYPVLYMFDGHNVFFDDDATYGKSWGMAEYLERSKANIIIAAVECNHDSDNGRLKEYSPFDFEDEEFGSFKGRGKATMEWYVNIFKRRIDRSYRTLPDRAHTYIAGSSMGGLMSLYALLEYNSVFSRAAALSPSLWVSPEGLKKMLMKAKLDKDTVLYMDYGSEEFGNHLGQRAAFGEMASMLIAKGVALDCRIVPGGSHCEASWEKQIPFFMHTLMYH